MSRQIDRFYVRFQGRVLGPITRDKTLELVKRGQITGQHELSPDGIAWKMAEDFPEFFEKPSFPIDRIEVRPASPPNEVPRVEWYAHCDGINRGPIDEAGMKHWIQSSVVSQDTMVWQSGMLDWSPAAAVRPEWFRDSRSTGYNSLHTHSPDLSQNQPGTLDASGIAVKDFASKKIAAGICGILLGGLGIHKFILGLTTPGTIMLTVWLVGMFSGLCIVVPLLASIVMNIIGLVEGIIYLTKSDDDFYQTYAIRKKEWF